MIDIEHRCSHVQMLEEWKPKFRKENRKFTMDEYHQRICMFIIRLKAGSSSGSSEELGG